MKQETAEVQSVTDGTVRRVLQFSQQKVSRIMWMFAAHVLITLVSATLVPSSAETLLSLFGTCLPFYLAGIAGYDIKAALENVQKIKNAAQSLGEKNANDGNG